MKNIIIGIIFLIAATLSAKSKPVPGFTTFLFGEPTQGKAFVHQVPQGECGVSCIAQADNGFVYAGTRVIKGTTPWIIAYDPVKKSIPTGNYWPLSKTIVGEKCVSALVSASDGLLYGSTTNFRTVDYMDKAVVEDGSYKGGHLFSLKPEPQYPVMVDLGIPFKGEGIVALIGDRKKSIVYGMTSPGLIVFTLNTTTKKIDSLGSLGGVEVWRNLYIGKPASALVLDDSGCLYGSAPHGKLFQYNPATKKLIILSSSIPTEGEGQDYDAVTAWTKTASGRIFGGTFLDGKLFEFIPKSGAVKPFGITSRTGHIRSLVEKDGTLYGFSGSEKSGSRLFAFNTTTCEHKCFPEFKVYFKETSNKWIPYQLEDFILLKDGTLMAGENSDNGHLMLYEPTPLEWVK
ncbi:MAG: hypothetical protein JNL74_00205 [Fibrobacteres bacterium]|nr:hypothetical protein [Fibrobacterota bacterium]